MTAWCVAPGLVAWVAVGADAHVATVVQVWTAVCVLRCDVAVAVAVAVATQFLTRHSGSGGSTAVNSDFWTNATYVNKSLFIKVTSVNSDFFYKHDFYT